jgi:hypothetical protein
VSENSPGEIARALRHDLKYAALTARNLDPAAPLEAWAAGSILRDLFETRRGLSALALAEEAARRLPPRLADRAREVASRARALEAFRAPLLNGAADVAGISAAVAALLAAADALVAAAEAP